MASSSTPVLVKEVKTLKTLCPRADVHLTPSLLLGPLLEDFAFWLVANGLSLNFVRNRIHTTREFDSLLAPHGDFKFGRLTKD